MGGKSKGFSEPLQWSTFVELTGATPEEGGQEHEGVHIRMLRSLHFIL